MQEENKSTTQDANCWQQHVDQFQQFKQSKLSYCKQYDLSYHRFLYWFSKLTGDDRPVQPTSTLIPVRLSKKVDKNNLVASHYVEQWYDYQYTSKGCSVSFD